MFKFLYFLTKNPDIKHSSHLSTQSHTLYQHSVFHYSVTAAFGMQSVQFLLLSLPTLLPVSLPTRHMLRSLKTIPPYTSPLPVLQSLLFLIRYIDFQKQRLYHIRHDAQQILRCVSCRPCKYPKPPFFPILQFLPHGRTYLTS